MNNHQKILIALVNGERIVRRGECSWAWVNRTKYSPPLTNAVTSRMFRCGQVDDVGGEMMLTSLGKIIAMRTSEECTES